MKHANVTLLGLLAGSLLLALVDDAAAQERQRRGSRRYRGCYALRVRSPEAGPSQNGSRKLSFSAAEILDLQLELLFPYRLSGSHRVALQVFAPNGDLYQTIELPFDDGDDAVQVHKVRRRSRRRRYKSVSAILPVAGTTIVSSSLYGEWRVEAFLDGGEAACAAPRRFELTP